ncbi:XRE family transcriptional regulator [Lactococcus petauri]|uniref:XRE family transcriptional regulator n=1 Tax=Lactococcus petauri TaxID=1940789 RepID=UPI0022E12C83|nr:XRE family transcriptional regulator [Lactococcus petauri]
MEIEQINQYVGAKIKEYRKSNGLKQDELAKKIGVGKTTISNYEVGLRSPKKPQMIKLSEVFGVAIDDFFPKTNFSEDVAPTSPLIEKTIDNMKKLTEERQENVLKFSKMQLDEQSEAIEKQKVITINNKKPSDVDADGIDWDEWVAFDGRPMSEHDKQVIKEHLGDELKD